MLKETFNTLFEDYYIDNDDWVYGNNKLFIVYRWVILRWNDSTMGHYLKLGYLKDSSEFTVDITHLTLGSGVKVLRRCPICYKEDYLIWQGLTKRDNTVCVQCRATERSYTMKYLNSIISSFPDQRWVVISDMIHLQGGSRKTYRKCLCKCGNIKLVETWVLKNGQSRSCGCLSFDFLSRTGDDHHCWRGGRIDYYGESWVKQRRLARQRDNSICQRCGKTKEENGRNMDVHHIRKFKSFGYIAGENRNDIEANDLDNLICLCKTCHPKVEANPDTIDDFRNNSETVTLKEIKYEK